MRDRPCPTCGWAIRPSRAHGCPRDPAKYYDAVMKDRTKELRAMADAEQPKQDPVSSPVYLDASGGLGLLNRDSDPPFPDGYSVFVVPDTARPAEDPDKDDPLLVFERIAEQFGVVVASRDDEVFHEAARRMLRRFQQVPDERWPYTFQMFHGRVRLLVLKACPA